MQPSNLENLHPFYQATVQLFEQEGWPYVPMMSDEEDALVLLTDLNLDNGEVPSLLYASYPERLLLFSSALPVTVEPPRQEAMMHFITRVNAALAFGSFDLETSDGRVQFRTALIAGDEAFPTESLRMMIHINARTFDHYLPSLQAILDGFSVESALALAQRAQNDEAG